MKTIITLKLATSLDAYIDDDNQERVILSSEEDLNAVDKLRSEHDAILVGAKTILKDNPKLIIKNKNFVQNRIKNNQTANPTRMTITKSGNIPTDSDFFNDDDIRKIVFSEQDNPELSKIAEVVQIKDNQTIESIKQFLINNKINSLLVEGGAETFALFFNVGFFDYIRIATAPLIISSQNAPRFPSNLDPNITANLKIFKQENFADTKVTWIKQNI